MSRTQKTLLNARVNLIFYTLTLILSFFSRKIFLDKLGADFIGLTGTVGNILGFLNLAELGVGGAVTFALYRPLFEKDHQTITEIVSVFGYLYRWIGIAVLLIGMIVSAFFPLIFEKVLFPMPIIYALFYAYLGSMLIGYFLNYRQTVLQADQKGYVVAAYFQTATIIKTLIQMGIAYYSTNYYLYVIIEFSYSVIYSLILNWKLGKEYPWLKPVVKEGKALLKKYEVIKQKTFQLFFHNISMFVIFQTSQIMIYAFESLRMVAVYDNYMIVLNKITSLFNTILGGSEASIGNLIAEGNKERQMKVFEELWTVRFSVAIIFSFSIFILMDSFITLWIGANYLLDRTILLLIVINMFITMTHGVNGSFIAAFGLFGDVWAASIRSILNLILSVSLGALYGVSGIVAGTVVTSVVIVCLWKPYYLFSRGFHLSLWNYWKLILRLMVASLISIFLSMIFIKSITEYFVLNTFIGWSLYGVLVFIFISITDVLVRLILNPGMKMFVCRITKVIVRNQ